MVNQLSDLATPSLVDKVDQNSGSVGGFLKNLNSDQYQKLMTVLSNHLLFSVNSGSSNMQEIPSYSHSAGICFSLSLSSINSYSRLWIIDLGASRHICSNANFFVSLRPIWNSMVTLPNNVQIPVSMYGDV